MTLFHTGWRKIKMGRNSIEKLCDVELHLHAKTEKAILVSPDGMATKAKWVPKSMCEFEIKKKNLIAVTLPEWLAIENGFV
jgi:hypothetical protein